MPNLRTLLVAYDFSEDSDAAIGWAQELAGTTGASVHVLHVVRRPLEVLSPYEIPVPETLMAEVRRNAAERLAPVVERLKRSGVSAEAHVREGFTADAIVVEARSLRADLIVMGTRGLTGLKHVLLGSVAERTMHHAPCPVVTVKADSPGD